MTVSPSILSRLQILTCVLGVVAGLVPGLSFTAPFQGLDLAQATVAGESPGSLRVTRVEPDSAAEQAGFQTGDEILDAGDFAQARAALRAIQPGERRVFHVRNGSALRSVEAVGRKPQLAAVWYGHLWYPVAGGVFLLLGLWVFATGPLAPPPLWRSVPLGIVGFGLAVASAVAWAAESPFGRLRLWQRYAMGNGAEWHLGQNLLGSAAGLSLAVLAAIETRRRLSARVP